MNNLTDDDIKFLAFHLACQLEDYGNKIKKLRKQGNDMSLAREQWNKLEKLIYTKMIPESWLGPAPDYWPKD